jgi:signal transduction histidine kinase/ligand-binding sensor domain-containing protein
VCYPSAVYPSSIASGATISAADETGSAGIRWLHSVPWRRLVLDQMRRAHRSNTLHLIVLLSGLLAAAGDAAAERLPVKAYTLDHGLAHNRVKRIVEDSRGFLWFCTADGLSRFDGHQFTNYTVDDGLQAPSINDLVESTDGVYWVATNSAGVVRFDVVADTRPRTNGIAQPRFKLYAISPEPATNRVNVLHRDSAGMLWAGTDGGLFRMDDAHGEAAFHAVPLGIPSHAEIEAQVWALVEDRAANLWVATKFGLVRRGPDGRTTHYRIQPSAVDDVVTALLLDIDGQLWLGHRSGLITFDPKLLSSSTKADSAGSHSLPSGARRYTTGDGLPDNSVLSVRQSADRRLWIATLARDVTSFDGKLFRHHQLEHRVGDIYGSLTVDREGNLWLGTAAVGALKITAHGWITYDEADGFGTPVSSIFENRSGDLYVNSRAWRLSRFSSGSFATVRLGLRSTVTDASWRSVSGVIQDRMGEWWVATREGLHRFPRVDRFEQLAHVRAAAVYTTRDGLASSDVTRLFEDSRGDIWIASFGPASDVLTRWERASGSFHRYAKGDGLQPFTSALTFAEDAAGNVWIGFREGGLARYRDGRFTVLGPEDGLPAGGVNSIYSDQSGRLWLAISQGGLCRIDAPNAERPRVVAYTRAHGLTTDVVVSVTGDADGRIYVSSTKGIDRFDPRTETVKRYSAPAGFGGLEFYASLRDRNGGLWFCTTIGLLRFLPESEQEITPPPVLISAVHVAGVHRPLSALGEPTVSLPELDTSQNNIQIDFFGVDLGSDEALRYQYKLQGTTGDWTVPAPQRTVNYANLAPGAYRFLVRAVSADGTPSESTVVSFDILPPVWRRWWFLAIAASILTTIVGSVAHVRHKRLKALRDADEALRRAREERLAELERVRKRIATDLHDEVGSSLTRISLLSEVLQQRMASVERSLVEPLSSIACLSRELVDTMSDIVWAINPKKDHLSDLSQRMRHFASDLFTARQIAFRFYTPAAEHDIAVGANVRRELFMIFKEAVNNLVRHSGCSDAELELTANGNELVLCVSDNGRGIADEQAHAGHGLESMRERTEALGGKLEVVTAPGSGTSLTFVVPLPEEVPPAPSLRSGG